MAESELDNIADYDGPDVGEVAGPRLGGYRLRHSRAGKFIVRKSPELDKWWDQWGTPDLKQIWYSFGLEAFRRTSAHCGLAQFFDANKFKGKRCLEIGTMNGLTAVILSRRFESVVSIDIKPRNLVHGIFDFLKIKNVELHIVGNNDQKAEIIERETFDAAYSDGNHSLDAEDDFKLVERCGCVAFHEYWPFQPPVWELINKLRKKGTVTTGGAGNLFALWRRRDG